MKFKCRLFGHKWEHYKEDVPLFTENYLINTEFRICPHCFSKQQRVAWSGDDDFDWTFSGVQLSVEQSRDKKLKELGIKTK